MPRLPQQLSELRKYRQFITCSRIPRDTFGRGHSFDLRQQRSLSSRSKLYQAMSQGELAYIKDGRRRLIPKIGLRDYLARRLVGG